MNSFLVHRYEMVHALVVLPKMRTREAVDSDVFSSICSLFLQSLGIPKMKKLLVLDSFILMSITHCSLKDLFHPACLACVVSWFAFVVAIFMGHENGDKQRATKTQHVQGMLDETGSLMIFKFNEE